MDRLVEGMSTNPTLEAKHKIFLSHSGVQKEFVEHLCDALERRCYYPFFDRRCTSLPKGERFPQLILKAAQQCHMAVVVVSDDYFMSKWPMIELHTFVQAIKQKLNTKLKILPLFYQLSVHEFRDNRRRKKWYKQWEFFAKDDIEGRITVTQWKDALDVLGSFNGISYNRELMGIIAYQNDIVSNICSLISSDIIWEDSHVQGKLHIWKVLSIHIIPCHKM